jgi:hypothetical protein
MMAHTAVFFLKKKMSGLRHGGLGINGIVISRPMAMMKKGEFAVDQDGYRSPHSLSTYGTQVQQHLHHYHHREI